MELLQKQLDLLKKLYIKETDEKEKARLSNDIEDAIMSIADAKAEAKHAAKVAAEDAVKAKAEMNAIAVDSDIARAETAKKIAVVSPGMYKGFNLKYEVANAKDKFAAHPRLKNNLDRIAANPNGFEGVVKHFLDMYERATVGPMGRVKAPMQEGNDSEGGFLTPTEQRAELLSYVRQSSFMMPNCTHVPMTSDVMTIPKELANVTMAFTAEETAATVSDPTFANVTLTAKRLDAYTISSNELIQDASTPGGIAGILLSQFVEAMGQRLDSAVLKGAGTLVDGSGVLLAAGYSTVFATGSSNFSALIEADLRNIISQIPANRLGNAKWYGHRSPVWNFLYGLKDTQTRNLFIPDNVNGTNHMCLGYPVVMPEEMPATSAASTAMLLFGDLAGFYVGDRLTNINLFVDPYTRAISYQTVFLMFTRWAFANAMPNYYGRIVTAA